MNPMNPHDDKPMQALSSLKVVDLSWVVAGPAIGRVLADYGACVVRVESPKRVETARLMGPFIGADRNVESGALYGDVNAGKLGLALDLSLAEGREVVLDLVRWGDVLIESFAPGMMKRWGLDYERLRAIKPDLVMLSTSLAGATGPYASFAGYGGAGAAMSGFQYIAGYPDRPPKGPFGPYTDFVGPRFSLIALLAALDHRQRTGEGCFIDLAQSEAGIQFLGQAVADHSLQGRVAGRLGNRDPQMAPHGVYPCGSTPDSDTTWVAIAARSDEEWRRLAALVGGASLASDPRYASLEGRLQHAGALDELLATWTFEQSAADIEARLQGEGIAAHRASTSVDILADPQLAHRHHLVTVPHPTMGSTVVENSRWLLSDTPARVETAAPVYGQHNDEVLRGLLGYTEEKMTALAACGATRSS